LNFDQTYLLQTNLEKPSYEWIHLSDIESTKRYCELDSLDRISQRLQKRRNRGVTLIGSGNYHYVSYLLLSEIEKPFTLLLFDHHTDMMEAPSATLLSCGSWVLEAIDKLPMLQKVILIGVNHKLKKLIPPHMHPIVSVHANDISGGWYSWDRNILSDIPTQLVYISIDKDVLDRTEAETDWDQGNMKLNDLLQMLRSIAAHKEIVGVDICGEYPFSPMGLYRMESQQAIRKNEQANQLILDTVTQIM